MSWRVSQVCCSLVHDAFLLEVDDQLHGGARLERDVRGEMQPLEKGALALRSVTYCRMVCIDLE